VTHYKANLSTLLTCASGNRDIQGPMPKQPISLDILAFAHLMY